MTFQICGQVVDLEIQRDGNKPWGLRIVGGADVATVMKVAAGSCFNIKNIKTSYSNIKIFKCCAGGESPWDRHSSIQGRPEVRGRVGGGAGGADHHDDPPPGQPLHVPCNP